MLKIYDIDYKYVKYLQKFDCNIRDPKETSHFGRKYVGIVLTYNNYKYFAPLTSKIWEYKMIKGKIKYILDKNGNKILKNNFSDVYIKNRNGEYIAAIKLNNMFPLPNGRESNVSSIVKISNYQNSSNLSDKKYAAILLDENSFIKQEEIEKKIISMANRFHRDYRFNNLMKSISCDFKVLETISNDYFKR